MGEYGIRWAEINRRWQLVEKVKYFATEKQRQAFVNKLERKEGFVRFTAWLEPSCAA
jgi:hypothetical protein